MHVQTYCGMYKTCVSVFVSEKTMAGCTLKCVLADRVFLKDEQASVRVRQDGTLGPVEGISFLTEHGHEQLSDLYTCVNAFRLQ